MRTRLARWLCLLGALPALAALGVLATLAPASALGAPTCADYRLAPQWVAAAYPPIYPDCDIYGFLGLALNEGYAYLTQSYYGLQVVDVRNPLAPAYVGAVTLAGEAYTIEADSDRACALLEGSRFQVIDLSNPALPSPGGVVTISRLGALAMTGDLAYAGSDSLVIFDVSDAAAPRRLGSVALPSGAKDIAIAGGLAYVTDSSGLSVVDVADSAAPVLLRTVACTNLSLLALVPPRLYARNDTGLTLFDLADPRNPALVSTAAAEVAWGLAAAGELVVITGGYRVTVLDWSQTQAPRERSHLSTPAGFSWGIGKLAISGRYLFVAERGDCEQDGGVNSPALHVFDLAHPDSIPALNAGESAFWEEDASSVEVAGDLVCQWAGDGIRLIDAADPAHPALLGQVPLDASSGGRLGMKGNLVFAASYSFHYPQSPAGWLKIVDVANPRQPVQIGQLDLPANELGGSLAVGDGLVFWSVQRSGAQSDTYPLYVVDVADPTVPRLRGEVLVPGIRDLAVADSVVFAARGVGGIQVIDVRDPDAPTLSTSVNCRAFELQVVGNQLYVGDPGYSLRSAPNNDPRGTFSVYDVSAPAAPQLMGSVRVPYKIESMAVLGRFAYLAGNAIQVVDVATPERMRLVSEFFAPVALWWDRDIAAGNGVLHVAAYDYTIWAPQCDVTTAAFLASFTATPRADRVDLAWSVTGAAEPADFRVTAQAGAQQWELPSRMLPDGTFAAEGGAALGAAGQRVTYTLWHREGGSWQWLAEQTVAVSGVPAATRLLAVAPNPFNPRVTVRLVVARPQAVEVAVYDLRGRRVARLSDKMLAAGEHTLTWDGRNDAGQAVPSGAYLVRMRSEDGLESRKITLAR